MTLLSLTQITVATLVVYSLVGFLLSRLLKRNDIADVLWGVGIFVVALVGFLLTDHNPLTILLTLMIGVWAVRLSGRIFLRNRKKTEDKRYQELSKSWGKWFFLRSYLQVFLLQSMLMVVVGYPALHAAVFGNTLTNFSVIVWVGLIVWMIGFFFETVSDYQLDRFLQNPQNKGTILTTGLWRYSRHPNYFGEVTQWWGIFLMVVTLPYGIYAIVSPLMITFLILKVSGIPMLEKAFEGNPAFEEYKRKTSAFFPLPPRT